MPAKQRCDPSNRPIIPHYPPPTATNPIYKQWTKPDGHAGTGGSSQVIPSGAAWVKGSEGGSLAPSCELASEVTQQRPSGRPGRSCVWCGVLNHWQTSTWGGESSVCVEALAEEECAGKEEEEREGREGGKCGEDQGDRIIEGRGIDRERGQRQVRTGRMGWIGRE